MKKTDQHYDIPVEDVDPVDLPENAFVELGKDEEYRPVMHPAREYKEVTVYSVTTGMNSNIGEKMAPVRRKKLETDGGIC